MTIEKYNEVQLFQNSNIFTEWMMENVIFTYVYVAWCIVVYIIDAVVCGDIFYRTCTEENCYIQQLYSLPNMDYELSHWLQVYGATSVTKLVIFPFMLINPLLILIINSYLYATSLNINSSLETQCIDKTINQTITCQVFNNPFQYKQLTELNKIQLFGSIVIICLIPLTIILLTLPKYIYDVSVRFHKRICCRCYTKACQTIFYIFCYGPESPNLPVAKVYTQSNEINLV